MLEWINSHGVETIIIWGVFMAIVDSMPALPENASYVKRWIYAFLHIASMNMTTALRLTKAPMQPDSKQ